MPSAARDTVVDWLMLTPPALLDATGARTGRYRIGGETVPSASARLSYADLAVAVVDEIDTPGTTAPASRSSTECAVHERPPARTP
ncbi:NAD(P)-dependent oxidoreductase [Sphaerisporangium rhizosphaerae]|uniref:Uncharacterized protein n=1 Tax=Sphaerisporangium rhizosphaerae TaxID=2269375 RepID=A0ABW2PFT8_9ACTN